MTQFIKNSIYTSIGVISITNEKFKELLEDLIQNNHYTQDEGKRITDDFLFELREHIDNMNVTILAKVDEFMQKYGLPHLYTMKDTVESYVNDVKENPTNILRLPSMKS